VVDTATLEPDRDPVADIEALEAELAEYGGLDGRPRIIALNKVDVPDGRDLADIVEPDLAKFGWPIYRVSAATREGLRELVFGMSKLVNEHRLATPILEPKRIVIRPKAVDDAGFTITQDEEEVFVVSGVQAERWVRQTNFDNDEAIGYLADRLARLGVEEALEKAGAVPGSPVRIGIREFDWQPTIYAGKEYVPGNRGTDIRLDSKSSRAATSDRLAARKERRVHREYEAEMAAKADVVDESDE
jgi:GTP-binding protein